ncbi:16236_t:CDS:2 [Funneliformis mosseae]|uniref:16236_t:CDS:1 n=1 Tax=Funneliformis mosseae TaxID=27381 RepID=A0A9N9BSI8_FUNMO|nr:16236_t:CDS:2 [Funneliformis mosseae]
MGLYVFRKFGSKYPAVKSLDIGATNADKKVMTEIESISSDSSYFSKSEVEEIVASECGSFEGMILDVKICHYTIQPNRL